jgi:excisionase family DNA binding protein
LPIAVTIEDAPRAVGVSRTRIFEAIRNKEIAARKVGRSTIIEVDELRRWVRSLPVKGAA